MLIASAHAQSMDKTFETLEKTPTPEDAPPPSVMAEVGSKLGLLFILVLLFYFLMVRPQQKRMKEHGQMLAGLKKGQEVAVSGGLIGKITKIDEKSDVVDVEISKGVTVKAKRYSLAATQDNDKKK